MSYFTAVIAADGRGWRTRDVDVEDAASLEDLADTLRAVGRRGRPVLAVIEHEDEWFALVRVDGDDEPRVFVSDLSAASRGIFAELLASAGDVDSSYPEPRSPVDEAGGVGGDVGTDDAADPLEPDDLGAGSAEIAGEAGDSDDPVVDLDDLEEDDAEPPPSWAGHADLLVDLGVSAELMLELCDKHSDDPGSVLAEIGELGGFAELLDALR